MAESHSTVIYLDIKDWPGYRVGDDGSVWRLWVTCRWGRQLGTKWRPMKVAVGAKGYLRVNLTPPDGGSYKTVRVHVLVLEAFVGPRPPGMEGRHLDGDKGNAALHGDDGEIRLAWGTPEQNRQDNRDLGAYQGGSGHSQAKTTELTVRSIRERYESGGVLLRELADEHGMSLAAIHAIIQRRTWKHVV